MRIIATILAAAFFFPAPPANKAYTVTSVQPIDVTGNLGLGKGFVIGGDGKARRCPDQKNVAPYVRVESVHEQLVFQYIDSLAILQSKPDQVFTLACLKVE